MASRLPAIPTLPPHVDPAVRQAFDAMREVVRSMQGVRGDARDVRVTSEELSSLYNRIFTLEREAQAVVDRTTRTATVTSSERGDQAQIFTFVYDASDISGSVNAAETADVTTASGAVATGATVDGVETGDVGAIYVLVPITGTLAATDADDGRALAGTVT